MKLKYITEKDFEKMQHQAKESIKDIPVRYNRKREEAEEKELMALIRKSKGRKEGKPKYLLISESYNQGTCQWSHCIRVVRKVNIEDRLPCETPCTLYRRRKENILAIIKK